VRNFNFIYEETGIVKRQIAHMVILFLGFKKHDHTHHEASIAG